MSYIEKVGGPYVQPWFDPSAVPALDSQIELIASKLPVSTNDTSIVLRSVGTSLGTFAGKRVLDLASGLCPFVADLRGAGIDITGLDIGYGDLEDMKRRAYQYDNEGTYKYMGSLDEFNEVDRATIEMMLARFNGGGRDECLGDIADHPSSYIAGSALALPFADATFNSVVCHSFLTSEPGLSKDFTEAVVMEAMRVIVPGGDMRIGCNDFEGDRIRPSMQKEENLIEAFKTARRSGLANDILAMAVSEFEKGYLIKR